MHVCFKNVGFHVAFLVFHGSRVYYFHGMVHDSHVCYFHDSAALPINFAVNRGLSEHVVSIFEQNDSGFSDCRKFFRETTCPRSQKYLRRV